MTKKNSENETKPMPGGEDGTAATESSSKKVVEEHFEGKEVQEVEEIHSDFAKYTIDQVSNIVGKAITSITRAKSFFKEQDVKRYVLNQSQKQLGDKVIEHPKFSAMMDLLIQNLNLLAIGDSGYFTTEEISTREKMLLGYAGVETNEHMLNKKIVDTAIQSKKGISDEQTDSVIASCLSNKRVTVVEGTAGAGKSFTMEAIKEAYIGSGYDVMGTALSWNAAKILESSAGLPNCISIESFVSAMLKAREAGTEYFRKPTLIIVDEAGLVGTRHMFHLLEETHKSKVKIKVVLTGDSLQLNPVDAGNTLQAIVEFHGTSRINTIRRQKQASHRASVLRFSERQAGKGLYPFLHQEAIIFGDNNEDVIHRVVEDFISYKHAFPEKKALILALSNKDVAIINGRVRDAYKKMGLIGKSEIVIPVTDGKAVWDSSFSVGDEVVVRANSKDLEVYEIPKNVDERDASKWNLIRTGVFNRNSGRVVGLQRSKTTIGSYDVFIDLEGENPGRVVLNTTNFKHQEKFAFPVVHNFATTIYASQGQTVDKVFLIDSPRIEFRLAYVGMSRHKGSVDIYVDQLEMHQRIDKMLGKKPTFDSIKTIGRYNHAEMLQMMAVAWSKQSVNLTVMMFDRERKVGKKLAIDEKELAILRKGDSADVVVDFDQTTNVPFKKIDLKKLMDVGLAEDALLVEDIPDEILHEAVVKVQEQKSSKEYDCSIPEIQSTSASHKGVLSKMFSWLATNPEDEIKRRKEKEITAVFEELKVTEGEKILTKEPTIKENKNIPFKEEEPELGSINEEGDLVLVGDNAPAPDFLKNLKEEVWAIGRENYPRILAKDNHGEIVSRFSLSGKCVVGDGYPPIILNEKSKVNTVLLLPGVREWLRTQEFQKKKYKDDLGKMPHMVWAAKEVNWDWISTPMKSMRVVIARSQKDESQLEWALDLQKELLSRFGIQADITPRPPVADIVSTPGNNAVNEVPIGTQKKRTFKRP